MSMTYSRVGASKTDVDSYTQNVHNQVDLTELVRAVRESQCNIHIPQAVADVEVHPPQIYMDLSPLIEAIQAISFNVAAPAIHNTIPQAAPPIIHIHHKHHVLWAILLIQTLTAIALVILYATKNHG